MNNEMSAWVRATRNVDALKALHQAVVDRLGELGSDVPQTKPGGQRMTGPSPAVTGTTPVAELHAAEKRRVEASELAHAAAEERTEAQLASGAVRPTGQTSTVATTKLEAAVPPTSEEGKQAKAKEAEKDKKAADKDEEDDKKGGKRGK